LGKSMRKAKMMGYTWAYKQNRRLPSMAESCQCPRIGMSSTKLCLHLKELD
jgi:hypothetical protein